MRIKKILPIVFAVALLFIPMYAGAYSKNLTMNMQEKSKTITCDCYLAKVTGGALIGGKGINYKIYYKIKGTLTTKQITSGSCASNTKFPAYEFSTAAQYSSCYLSLNESQRSKDNPGIGWGLIKYDD